MKIEEFFKYYSYAPLLVFDTSLASSDEKDRLVFKDASNAVTRFNNSKFRSDRLYVYRGSVFLAKLELEKSSDYIIVKMDVARNLNKASPLARNKDELNSIVEEFSMVDRGKYYVGFFKR